MSFSIDGAVWEPETTLEHAEKIRNGVNALLLENGITDQDGNTLQMTRSFANAFWLLSLAFGNRVADMDEKLQAAINSFNIALCDDQQVSNLLPITGVTPSHGSYSTVGLECTASQDGTCVVPKGTRIETPDGHEFLTDSRLVLSAGSTGAVTATCSEVGPVVVLAGKLTAFSTRVANLAKVTNPKSSIPGKAAETVASMRSRILLGNTVAYSLEGVQEAILELTGISFCHIYFNYSSTAPLPIAGGVSLLPRHAYIVVEGDSDKIAATYSHYMTAETQNGDGTDSVKYTKAEGLSEWDPSVTYYTMASDGKYAEVDQSVVTKPVSGTDYYTRNTLQFFMTGAGQQVPVMYDHAGHRTVYVRIVLKSGYDATDGVVGQLCGDLIEASSTWNIGELVTTLLTGAVFESVTYTSVAYTNVSLDGKTWTDSVDPGANYRPVVSDDTISVMSIDMLSAASASTAAEGV